MFLKVNFEAKERNPNICSKVSRLKEPGLARQTWTNIKGNYSERRRKKSPHWWINRAWDSYSLLRFARMHFEGNTSQMQTGKQLLQVNMIVVNADQNAKPLLLAFSNFVKSADWEWNWIVSAQQMRNSPSMLGPQKTGEKIWIIWS